MKFTEWVQKASRMFKRDQKFSTLVTLDIGLYKSTTTDYKAIAEEGYGANADVYACVNKIVTEAKNVKWTIYKKIPKTSKRNGLVKSVTALEEVDDPNHSLYKLLQRPNPFMSMSAFTMYWLSYYLLSGNYFISRLGPTTRTAPPVELWPMRPDQMHIDPSNDSDLIAGYYWEIVNKPNSRKDFKPDRIIDGYPWHTVMHCKMFNPLDSWLGLPPLAAAALNIDMSNMAAQSNLSLIRNGMRPSGAFVTEEILDTQQQKDLRKDINESWAGPQNTGKALLLHGGLDWKELGVSPKDADQLENTKLSTRKICSVFGVAPELIGDHQNKTYNVPKEARKALMLEVVLPHLDEFAEELNRWLVPLYPDEDLVIGYDKDQIEVIKDERQAVWMNVDRAVVDGWLTPNEGREAVGYERIDDPEADKLRKPEPKGPFDSSNRPEDPAADPNRNQNRARAN